VIKKSTLKKSSPKKKVGKRSVKKQAVNKLSELMTKVIEGESKTQKLALRSLYLKTKNDLSKLIPFKETLLRLAANESRPELRWYLTYIIPFLGLTKSEKDWARGLFTAWYENPGKSRAVKTLAMQALFDLAGNDFHQLATVEEILSESLKDPAPAVRARARILFKQLTKIDFKK
jgi:hypothetical protein